MLKFGSRKKYADSPLILAGLSLFSILLIIIISLASSFVVLKSSNPLNGVGTGAMVSLIASGIISGVLCQSVTSDIRKTAISLGGAAAILLCVSIVFGNIGCGVMNVLCFFGTGMAVCFLVKSFFGKRRKRR